MAHRVSHRFGPASYCLCAVLRSDWHYLFTSSGKGLVGRELGEAISSFESPLIPKFGWLIAVGRNVNMSEETVLTVAWVCLLSAGCLLLLGLLSRPVAIIAWFVHLCAAESGGLTRLWRRQFYDNGALLPDVISTSRPLRL